MEGGLVEVFVGKEAGKMGLSDGGWLECLTVFEEMKDLVSQLAQSRMKKEAGGKLR